MSIFEGITSAPADPIFGVAQLYNASPLSTKVLLSVGVYRTENGEPYVFPAVSKAEDEILHKFDKDYLPMLGYSPFLEHSRDLLWGESILKESGFRIGTVQSCAGTGGLLMVSKFVQNHLKVPQVLLSDPCWPNYRQIFGACATIGFYPWVANGRLDLSGLLSSVRSAPDGSLIVLQVVGHNPTGIDPTLEDWREIFQAIDSRKHIICFDFAYMGFGSGDPNTDAEPVREYLRSGREFFVAFSFSKCMGLYGERVGALHIVTNSSSEARIVESQMMRVGRQTWSVCPQNGALIAAEVLGNTSLKAEWLNELREISARIRDIRHTLCDLLEQKTSISWDFARKQQGMFMFTGLNEHQVMELGHRGVFIPSNGRISIPALNHGNVEFVAEAIANVVNGS
jgi:aspartate/tyrosine/aromatic aminotransferase